LKHKPTFVENMTRNYHRSRIDANQPAIVAIFRMKGWYVLHTHDLKNACDLMVVKDGRTIAIEIKDNDKPPSARELSEGEKKFRDNWTTNGGEWMLIECIEDVLKIAPLAHHNSGGRRSPE
tara:strand:+ start:2022 stop:2384 length:363 start_codon:yes stop_codon:yes gene_type:complete